ncbi:MAG: hypothetical protein H0U12_13380 [Thermoleophilaceae bacterium]|nr:hypothetical protein [Thermoleophilaceae bacterium]
MTREPAARAPPLDTEPQRPEQLAPLALRRSGELGELRPARGLAQPLCKEVVRAEAVDGEARDSGSVEAVHLLRELAHRVQAREGGQATEDTEHLGAPDRPDRAVGRKRPERAHGRLALRIVDYEQQGCRTAVGARPPCLAQGTLVDDAGVTDFDAAEDDAGGDVTGGGADEPRPRKRGERLEDLSGAHRVERPTPRTR